MAAAGETFNIADAVTLFSEQSTTITTLWTVFVAASFSAAGIGLTDKGLSTYQQWGVTLGYLTFAAGHFSMLLVCIKLQDCLASEIRAAIATHAQDFSTSLARLLKHRSNVPLALIGHIAVDICVIVIIWTPGSTRPNEGAKYGGASPAAAIESQAGLKP